MTETQTFSQIQNKLKDFAKEVCKLELSNHFRNIRNDTRDVIALAMVPHCMPGSEFGVNREVIAVLVKSQVSKAREIDITEYHDTFSAFCDGVARSIDFFHAGILSGEYGPMDFVKHARFRT